MRLCRSSILVFTYFSCLGFYINTPSAATSNSVPQVLEFAQANSRVAATPAVLRPGSQGSDVQRLQIQLKKLGYYSGAVNGKYSVTTEIGVAKFQKVKGLKVDGIFGLETRIRLQAALAAKSQLSRSPVLKSPIVNSTAAIPKPTAKPQPTEKERDLIWWLILAVGVFGSFGAFIFLMRWFRQVKRVQKSEISNTKSLSQVKQDPVTAVSSENVTSSQITKLPQTTQLLLPEKTSRLAKLNIVDELIQDLRNPDPTKRHKAIWNLGQQGDSRAIQPMVDLMIDADSQESSLILAALAEIGARTLKPMNRALAMSMQDENPQVRQNAIRDLTRVYDMMSQMSQILCHALEDPDAEVQATARYALSKMNRIRALPEQQNISED
ncbi:MAG: peptidoglycan-binding protein [Nostoc sp. GBBB01]|jgi:peptidoglycan hydrolase-like protein with peptidoglycan-binding domain|uniref:HEAT repeat domain-containing protein n=1 Tax=Nostoc punctiforme FACHB-252 TaxID=1357509 RepID=A0ABR8H2Q4_NOSPU|nr:peptidoglycan-binding protein [Nostoc punctiforme]MBD2609712.1 HEAT repeat domain-containing protein [Nostoc punctiforme FACHB-252]MBL1200361.1 peptidoglycan-binding protein [Nostoc sp. GBBB01]